MEYNVTNIFNKNLAALKRDDIGLIVNRGGLRSSKTVSILQLLTLHAIKHPNTELLFVSSTHKKVMLSLFKDWKKFAIGDNYTKLGEMNLTNGMYTFKNGSSIRFQTGNLKSEEYRGDSYDIAFIDEVNNINEEVFGEISDRIRNKVFVAFYPTVEFYITDEIEKRDDVIEFISTFEGNPHISQKQKDRWYAKGKLNPNFKRVMIDGEYGSVDGLIFEEGTNWNIIDELPDLKNCDLELWGIDWGYKPDPTSINQIRFVGDSIYIKEHLYQTNLIPSAIAKKIKYLNDRNVKMIADNARPEIIAEMSRTYGINVQAVSPKPGILSSIAKLKEKQIFVTEDSFNVIQEFRYYQWHPTKKDKHGNTVPIDDYNHAIDNIRYVTATHYMNDNDGFELIKI